MGKYCDSKTLENNWFDWLVSSSVPVLDKYREHGLLWTKVLGEVRDDSGEILTKNGSTFIDPVYPRRGHYLALSVPVYFESYHDKPQSKGTILTNGKEQKILLDKIDNELNILSNSCLHKLNDPLFAQLHVIPKLRNDGYKLEKPISKTWHAVLEDINKMCQGIVTKFNLPSEEERMELSQDAFLQVTNKLVNRKLVYTPGRAPVFNLLTTTIFRIMYSIQNKKRNQRDGMRRLIDDMQAGSLPDNIRSFRAGMSGKRTSTQQIIKAY